MKTIDLKHSFRINLESTTIIIENVQHRLVNQNIHTHSHGEHCYEIHYVQGGSGKLFLDNKTHSLTPGLLFMAGPNIKHAQFPDTEYPLDEYYVYFTIKKLPASLNKEESEWNFLISALINTPSWFGDDKFNASVIMSELLNTALKKDIGYQTELKGLFLQFLTRLIRNILPEDSLTKNNNPENNQTSLHKILEHSFSQYDITLDKLASELFLSQRQTERIIKSIYGKSFSQKKKEARMLAASDLLLSSDKPINEISDILCFSSIGHFSSQFSKYYGKTPSQYRKQITSL